jgi:hypothetical protein
MARTQPELERTANLLAGSLVLYWMGRGCLCLSRTWRDVAFEALEPLGFGGEVLQAALPWVSAFSVVLAGLLVWRPASVTVLSLQVTFAVLLAVGAIVAAPSLMLIGFGGLPRLIGLVAITCALVEARRVSPRIGAIDRFLRLGIACWLITSGVIGWVAPAASEVDLVHSLGATARNGAFVVQGVAGFEILGGLLLLVTRPVDAAQTLVLWAGLVALSGVPVCLIALTPEAFWHPTTPHTAGFLPMACMAAILFGEQKQSLRLARTLEVVLIRASRVQALIKGTPRSSETAVGVIDGIVLATRSYGRLGASTAWLSGTFAGRLVRCVPMLSRNFARAELQRLQSDLSDVIALLPHDDIQSVPLRSLSRKLSALPTLDSRR